MCKRQAEWVLNETDPYMETYSCNKHLSQMTADSTTSIYPYSDPDVKCCHLLCLPRWLWFVARFLAK